MPFGEGLVPLGDHVEQIPHGHDLAKGQAVALIDQQLQHHLERRALPLEQGGDRNEGLDQGWTEGVDLAEGAPVQLGRQQNTHHLVADARGLLPGLLDLLARRLAPGRQDAPGRDLRQIAVLQRDGVEARLPPTQHIRKAELLGTRDPLPHQLPQVPLAGHEADDGDRPVRALRLHQLRDLRPLCIQELLVRRMGGEPQDELIQEQHQGVVA